MLTDDGADRRELRQVDLQADLVVVGGGIAGVCAAITAARQGVRVVLVQNRPVLGGNASSEIRLWIVGATAHMGNNNRWAREGGVFNEILLENRYRNPEGNPVLFDTVLLEKVYEEPNLTLLLNTAVHEAAKGDNDEIQSLTAFCSQNSTQYTLRAPLFCDASGDGIVGFLAGAAFRMGVEAHDEFGELLAPASTSNELLGHSIYFYTRDAGRPIRYVAPSYALSDITKIPRYRRFNTKEQGTDLWWIEYGGSMDTVHESETIKWELWKIIYGVWDYIKNSGEFPDAETLTLDWVGLIPGKRESRRFEGEYMLVQQDVSQQRVHDDAVSYGGWPIDHHPVDNIYSGSEPCTQWHSKGVYQIPYRTMFSRNVLNLFLAGRIISASHVAFGSSRVMATCGHNAQAVGMAAALCREQHLQPRDLVQEPRIRELQTRLLQSGQYIPGVDRRDPSDLAQQAVVSASSALSCLDLAPSDSRPLTASRALLIPVEPGQAPEVTVFARSQRPAALTAELRICSHRACHTPDVVLDRIVVPLASHHWEQSPTAADRPEAIARRSSNHNSPPAKSNDKIVSRSPSGGSHREAAATTQTQAIHQVAVPLKFEAEIPAASYAFICLLANDELEVYESNQLITGVTTVKHGQNGKVANSNVQRPPMGSGVDEFELWIPERRPGSRNLAATIDLHPKSFAPENAINGCGRPTNQPNAWVASPDDPRPTLTLKWERPQRMRTIELAFDPDWDDPLENIVMQHHERTAPTVVRNFRILDSRQETLAEVRDNHQAIVRRQFESAISTDQITIELEHPSDAAPASLFEVRCYAE